jgi:hypothetical protein
MEDDGPDAGTFASDGDVAFVDGTSGTEDTDGSDGLIKIAPTGFDDGSDGQKSFIFTDVDITSDDTYTASGTGTNTIIIKDDDGIDTFQAVINADGSYTFTVLEDAPLTYTDLGFDAIKAGGPKELITDDLGLATFDGVLNIVSDGSSDDTGNGATFDNGGAGESGGPGDPDDDLNPDSVGFGDKLESASNFEEMGGFIAINESGFESLEFDVEGIGNTGDVLVHWEAYVDTNGNGILDDEDIAGVADALVDGGQTYFDDLRDKVDDHMVITPDEDFDFILVWFEIEEPFGDDGRNEVDEIRVQNVGIASRDIVPDIDIDFDVLLTDGDNDTDTSSFSVHVEADGIT